MIYKAALQYQIGTSFLGVNGLKTPSTQICRGSTY